MQNRPQNRLMQTPRNGDGEGGTKSNAAADCCATGVTHGVNGLLVIRRAMELKHCSRFFRPTGFAE